MLVVMGIISIIALIAGIKNNAMVNIFGFIFVVVLPPFWGIIGFFRFKGGRGTAFDGIGVFVGLVWFLVCLFFPLGFFVSFVASMAVFGAGSWIVSSTARNVRHTYRTVRRNVDEADGVYNPENYDQ
jgi:hypothetical protein